MKPTKGKILTRLALMVDCLTLGKLYKKAVSSYKKKQCVNEAANQI